MDIAMKHSSHILVFSSIFSIFTFLPLFSLLYFWRVLMEGGALWIPWVCPLCHQTHATHTARLTRTHTHTHTHTTPPPTHTHTPPPTPSKPPQSLNQHYQLTVNITSSKFSL